MADDDWDASSSDDAPAAPVKAPVAPVDWDDDEEEEEQPQDTAVTDDTKTQSSSTQQENNSTANPNPPTTNNQNNNKTSNNNKNNKNENKQQNKQKQNQKQKQRQSPPKQISTASKKQAKKYDSDSTTSSDSSDETAEQQQANAKMQSYDDRNYDDNAILFGGLDSAGGRGRGNRGRGRGRGNGRGGRGGDRGRGRGRGRGDAPDNRPMLSGDVRLSSFPLGSQRDCVNLAKQLCGVINQRRFDGDINAMDIVKFVTYMVDGLIAKNSNHIDIVDINEIKTQIDKIYNRKQKELRAGKKKKKPIHKFGKKYAAPPAHPTQSNQSSQGGRHVDGHYNADDFSFLD